jgi:diguanylate cyclase (GGDEF)-like protein
LDKILLIEDDRTLSKLISRKLSQDLDIEVDVAFTFKEAQDFVSKHNYFVVLSDLILPDGPNGEVVDMLLQNNQKVIVLSSLIDKRFRDLMMKKDIIDYVRKTGLSDINYITNMLKRLKKNTKHKILITDDSQVIRNQLISLLGNLYFEILIAKDGTEALEVLEKNSDISLLITDYNMPRMDGLELVDTIRKTRDKNSLSIIALSSVDDDETIAMFLKSGANDYVKKPFLKEEFYCRINNTIEAYENIQIILNTANRDFLTGLYNRRYFFDNIDKIIQEAKKSEDNVYIAMSDIDFFKKINDTFGHDEGDVAIISISEILRTNTMQKDLVARFGGEEFCLAITAKNSDNLKTILERIRKESEKFSFKTNDGRVVNFTISIGATQYIENENIEAAIKRADEALYEAKESGRNRVIIKI